MILAFLAWTYTQAIEITGRSPSVTSDYRIDDRHQQFDLLWFLKSVFLTRLSGIMVLSLIIPAILAVLNSCLALDPTELHLDSLSPSPIVVCSRLLCIDLALRAVQSVKSLSMWPRQFDRSVKEVDSTRCLWSRL